MSRGASNLPVIIKKQLFTIKNVLKDSFCAKKTDQQQFSIQLKKGANTLRLFNNTAPMPDIDYAEIGNWNEDQAETKVRRR